MNFLMFTCGLLVWVCHLKISNNPTPLRIFRRYHWLW